MIPILRFTTILPRARVGVAALLLAVLCVAAPAQPAKEMRAQLEAGRLELTQIEAALQRDTLDDKRLAELRARIEPLAQVVDEIIQREQPRADEIKARIEKLGPAPDPAKGVTESADVAKDRAEQQQQWREADETLRLSRALDLRLDQMKEAIAERRRQNFTRQILQQGASIVSPLLWIDVSKGLAGDFRAFRFLMRLWAEAIYTNLQWYEGIVLALLAFVAVVGLPRARHWAWSGSTGEAATGEAAWGEPARLGKALLALRLVLLNVLAPAALFFLVHWLFQSFGLLPGRADPVMESVTNGFAFVFAMGGLARGVLSPLRADRRLFALSDRMASELVRMIGLVAFLFALSKVFDALEAATVASLPMTVATKGVFAILIALALARGLTRSFGEAAMEGSSGGLLLVRLTAWTATVLIGGAALFGYVALAGFLTTQVVWLTILALVALLLLVFVDELLGAGLASTGLLGRRVREATGLTASSLDQLSVLGSGLARLILIVTTIMLALAPWGLDSSNLIGNLKGAFFGFQVGGVTISLSNIGMALAFFVLGSIATRAIQNWLETTYLPHTGLDRGLRNSIRTIFGYIGMIIATMAALSQLGFSLEKLTIVAGALSVGIGFGLRSIVENFVSGLILLWERPIRVGDWIVLGTEQGTVKRINVRATEIQTFDRASLIIPNSELISGRVKNWMHADRTGRIIIPVNVDYRADPEQVQALLKDAALAHREVMSEPGPVVIFKDLGESGLDFELRCFVDVDAMATTRSELLFDIFRRLREAGIDIPYPTRRLEITNLAAPGTPVSEADLLGADTGALAGTTKGEPR
jgi:potassium-dependent mechanosensitive channel